MNRLDEISARLEVATPGTWAWFNPETDQPVTGGDVARSLRTTWLHDTSVGPLPYFVLRHVEYESNSEADAELIANAPGDLATLLAVVREVAARHHRTSASQDPAWRHVTGLHDAYCAYCLTDWPCPDARAVQALTETTEETKK